MGREPEVTSTQAFVTAALIMSATWAFFTGPILEFADAGTVSALGGLVGLGAGGTWLAIHDDWNRKLKWLLVAVAIAGGLGLTWQTNIGLKNYEWNEARCSAIEADMLAVQPRRQDGPELYQALGCKPHNRTAVQFPL